MLAIERAFVVSVPQVGALNATVGVVIETDLALEEGCLWGRRHLGDGDIRGRESG